MPRWEYKTLMVDTKEFSGSTWDSIEQHIHDVDVVPSPYISHIKVELDLLGAQEWELVSTEQITIPVALETKHRAAEQNDPPKHHLLLFLKRQLKNKIQYYVKYEVTFIPFVIGDGESKYKPVSFKGEVTIPTGAMMESGERVKSAEDAEKVFWARYLNEEDELIDSSEVPFFDDGYTTSLKVLSFGEVEDH